MTDRTIGNIAGATILIALVFGMLRWVQARDGLFADYNAENANYAADYFGDLFSYDAVLASQRWHHLGVFNWDCTYAVVSIGHDPPVVQVTRDRHAGGWQFVWGGDWRATPAPELGDSTRDAIGFCAKRLPDDLGQRLQFVLSTARSVYVRDAVGETVMLYAPDYGLAARIRYGD